MTAHTPGPWILDEHVVKGCREDMYPIIAEIAYPAIDGPLITAAPDLLAALRACVRFLDMAFERSDGDLFGADHNAACNAFDAAQSAIEKATGGAA